MKAKLILPVVILASASLAHGRGMLIPVEPDLPPLAMLNHRVSVSLEDQVAVTKVEQTFRNHTSRRLEATYIFPVPEGASITDFAMWVNGQRVKALLDGDVKVDDFDESRFREPRALELVRKVTLRLEPSLTTPNREALGAHVEVTLRNGTVLRAEVPYPPGSLQNPASDASLVQKFLSLSESALGRARAQQAAKVILAVDSLSNLGELLDAVSSAARSSPTYG